MTADRDIQYVLSDCFLALGQGVGTDKHVEFDTIAWWHARYEVAFAHAGLDWKEHVVVDPAYFRPTEVDLLLGDPSKAKKALGWEPKVRFETLARMMVDADLELVKSQPSLVRR